MKITAAGMAVMVLIVEPADIDGVHLVAAISPDGPFDIARYLNRFDKITPGPVGNKTQPDAGTHTFSMRHVAVEHLVQGPVPADADQLICP